MGTTDPLLVDPEYLRAPKGGSPPDPSRRCTAALWPCARPQPATQQGRHRITLTYAASRGQPGLPWPPPGHHRRLGCLRGWSTTLLRVALHCVPDPQWVGPDQGPITGPWHMQGGITGSQGAGFINPPGRAREIERGVPPGRASPHRVGKMAVIYPRLYNVLV